MGSRSCVVVGRDVERTSRKRASTSVLRMKVNDEASPRPIRRGSNQKNLIRWDDRTCWDAVEVRPGNLACTQSGGTGLKFFTVGLAVALTWWAVVAAAGLGLLTTLTIAHPRGGALNWQTAKVGVRLSDDQIMHEMHPRLGHTFLGEASVAWHDAVKDRYFGARTGMLRISPLGRNENHFDMSSHACNGNCGDAFRRCSSRYD